MTDQLKRAISAAKTTQTNSEQVESISVASSSAGDQNFDMSESSYKTSHTAIRKARRFAMQGLYEWLVTDHRFDLKGKLGWKANAPHDIAARTRATNAMHTVHIGYYHEMMHDIPEQIETLNALISQHLDREIDKLDTVEHAILLIGSYELQNRLEIPYKVVLDESMKLNNHFGATDAHKLINAVLDKMAVELRAVEVQADTKANLRTSQKAATKKATTAPETIDMTESAATTESKPTGSAKPRISANNTSVKRNRPNKVNAGTSTAKAAAEKSIKAQKESAKPVATDKVDDVINTSVAAVNETIVNENTDKTLPESESSIIENNVLESGVSGSKLTEDKITDDSSANSAESNTSNLDSVSPDTVSSEVDVTEIDSMDLNDTELNSTDSKSKD